MSQPAPGPIRYVPPAEGVRPMYTLRYKQPGEPSSPSTEFTIYILLVHPNYALSSRNDEKFILLRTSDPNERSIQKMEELHIKYSASESASSERLKKGQHSPGAMLLCTADLGLLVPLSLVGTTKPPRFYDIKGLDRVQLEHMMQGKGPLTRLDESGPVVEPSSFVFGEPVTLLP